MEEFENNEAMIGTTSQELSVLSTETENNNDFWKGIITGIAGAALTVGIVNLGKKLVQKYKQKKEEKAQKPDGEESKEKVEKTKENSNE